MTMLGLSSKREVVRTSIRVRTAMAAQTRGQGRYLGGRPPYGYRLADAGPHPNKMHASWGRRAHRLEPDPETERVVRWVFTQRLAGHSVARIARALNDAGIPCPSAIDPARNPHRAGSGWTVRTVASILSNPRYTGRQVWNRQPTELRLFDPADISMGHRQVQRWSLPDTPVTPEDSPQPFKVLGERRVLAAEGPAVTVIRAALIYGRGGSAPLQGMIAGARARGVAAYIGEGSNEWSSVHVDDLARLYLAATSRQERRLVVNAASRAPTSMRQLAEAVAHLTGVSPVSLTPEQAQQAMGPYAAVLTRSAPLDPSRAEKVLGWNPVERGLTDELRAGSLGTAGMRPLSLIRPSAWPVRAGPAAAACGSAGAGRGGEFGHRRAGGPVTAAVDHDPASGRLVQARDHPHRRGLPGAVRAEETGDDSGLDHETQPVHRQFLAVTLTEILYFDHFYLPFSARGSEVLQNVMAQTAAGPLAGPAASLRTVRR
jgi:hypothetical protein